MKQPFSDRVFRPQTILLGQMAAVGCWLWFAGRLVPSVVNDTPGYAQFAWESLSVALNQIRTPGYPLFLKLNEWFAGDFRSVPLMQFVCYAAAVQVFFGGACRVLSSPRAACVAASSLLYTRLLFDHVSLVATESLAGAAGIAACGLLFRQQANSGSIDSVLLCLTAMTAWLIRPAYLFLIPLLPAMSLLSAFREPVRKSQWKNALLVLLLTAAPAIGYSLLRLAVVGRIGIVSFGGYNQIGVCGQFLNETDPDRLPDDLRPIARQVLQLRASGTLPRGKYDELDLLNYMRMEDRYDITVWHEFVPSAEQHLGQDPKVVNTALRQLSTEMIRLHTREYVVWNVKAVRQSAKKVLWDFADHPATLFLLFLALGRVVWQGLFSETPLTVPAGSDRRVLVLLAVSYLICSLAVVIPVGPPMGRLTDAAAIFLACPLAVWVFEPVGREERRRED